MISQFIGNIFGPVEPGQIFVIAGKTIDGASRYRKRISKLKIKIVLKIASN